MLGVTSYQEALRALGVELEPADQVSVIERSDAGRVVVGTPRGRRELTAADLESLVLSSHARRGRTLDAAGQLSDVLRSIGLGLDELHAHDVCLDMVPNSLSVRFRDRHAREHELSYVGDELDALRRSSLARRNGQPLRRVLILQDNSDAAASVQELLVAEFAVQSLPTLYARTIAEATQPPDLVLAQVNGEPDQAVAAIQTLRSGTRTAEVPIVVLAAADTRLDTDAAFAAGADDLLVEPVLPAQLRARIRTWLLRRR